MAENAPPMSAGASGQGDSSRGMPYYEKLRRDLRNTIKQKRELEERMSTIDDSIYKLEGDYLESTPAGNIIKGFDNYIKATSTSTSSGAGAGSSTRRKTGISDADRLFSRSSASALRQESTPSSAQTTPSHAPTPTSSFPQSARESNNPTPASSTAGKAAASNKKKKALDRDDDEGDGKPAKR
ncbi:hypothetical protein LTS18_009713, partial [Coniosporium uncinatum]